jgi:hypothetical protein
VPRDDEADVQNIRADEEAHSFLLKCPDLRLITIVEHLLMGPYPDEVSSLLCVLRHASPLPVAHEAKPGDKRLRDERLRDESQEDGGKRGSRQGKDLVYISCSPDDVDDYDGIPYS